MRNIIYTSRAITHLINETLIGVKEMNNITSSKFQYNFFGTKEINCESPYAFVNVDFFNEINVKGNTMPVVYQTGLSYYGADYNQPKNLLEISSQETAPVIIKINELQDTDFETMSSDDIVEYVGCDFLKTAEEIKELFLFLKEQKEEVNNLFKKIDWENETPIF